MPGRHPDAYVDMLLDTVYGGEPGEAVQAPGPTSSVASNPPFGALVAAGGKDISKGGMYFNIMAYGAKGDTQTVNDGAMNGTDGVLTCATSHPFVASDVGKMIQVGSAGAAGAPLATTIASFQSASQVTLAAVSQTAASAKGVTWESDDVVAITAAITAAGARGGVVFYPQGSYFISSSLPIAANVTHLGVGGTSQAAQSPDPPSVIRTGPAMVTPIFDLTAAGTVNSPGWRGLAFLGNRLSGTKAIHTGAVPFLNQPSIEDCFFDSFGDQAIHLENGAGGFLENLFLQNCLMIRTGRVAYVGVVDISLTDTQWQNVYATTSSAQTDAVGSGFLASFRANGANQFFRDTMTEFSITGYYIGPNCFWTRFDGARAQLNNGNGWVIDGTSNTFVNCYSERNSNATDNTYDGFVVQGGGNDFMACRVTNLVSDVRKHRFGFTDTVATGPATRYMFNRADNINGATYNPTFGAVPPTIIDQVPGGAVTIRNNQGRNDLQITDTTAEAGIKITTSGGNKYLRVSNSTFDILNAAASAALFSVNEQGLVYMQGQLYPGPETVNAEQVSGGFLHATGVPSNANGNNNDWVISDNSHLYTRRAGVWAQKDAALPVATTLALAIAPDLNVASFYNPPALSASPTIAAPLNPVAGQELVFQWTQNGTGGWTPAYNAVFKTTGVAAFVTTLSTVTIDRFVYDGTNWRILSRNTGQAL